MGSPFPNRYVGRSGIGCSRRASLEQRLGDLPSKPRRAASNVDWSKVNTPAQRREPPAPPRVATLFRVVGPSNRVVRCATYRVATGIELRLEYEDNEFNVLKTQLFLPEDDEALAELAAEWRAKFDALGSFHDLAVVD